MAQETPLGMALFVKSVEGRIVKHPYNVKINTGYCPPGLPGLGIKRILSYDLHRRRFEAVERTG
jgi:hypothetical protein